MGGIFYDADGKGATVELVPRAPYGTGNLPAVESFFYTTDHSWPQIGAQPERQPISILRLAPLARLHRVLPGPTV